MSKATTINLKGLNLVERNLLFSELLSLHQEATGFVSSEKLYHYLFNDNNLESKIYVKKNKGKIVAWACHLLRKNKIQPTVKKFKYSLQNSKYNYLKVLALILVSP